MRYEVLVGTPDNARNIEVEAPDELTAAYRAGLPNSLRETQAEVIAIRSEEEALHPVLPPEAPRVGDPE